MLFRSVSQSRYGAQVRYESIAWNQSVRGGMEKIIFAHIAIGLGKRGSGMKSPDNCVVTKKAHKDGIGGCRWWRHPREGFFCEGYQKSKIDDEPCEECKECHWCMFGEKKED